MLRIYLIVGSMRGLQSSPPQRSLQKELLHRSMQWLVLRRARPQGPVHSGRTACFMTTERETQASEDQVKRTEKRRAWEGQGHHRRALGT